MSLTWTFLCGGEVGVRLAARVIAYRSLRVGCRHAMAEAASARQSTVTVSTATCAIRLARLEGSNMIRDRRA